MKRHFLTLTTIVAAVLVLAAMGMGGVAAQENETNETAGDAAEDVVEAVTGETEADTMDNTETIRMGEHTEIVGWEFVDGTARVAIDTERTQRVTITDGAAGVGEAGATHIPEVRERVFGGEVTVLTVPVEEAMGGHVVGVEVAGEGVRLSTEMTDSGDDPLRHFGGQSGLFSGMLMAVLMSLGGAGYVLWSEDSGVRQA